MRQTFRMILAGGVCLGLAGTALAQPTTLGQPTKHQPGKIRLANTPAGAAVYQPDWLYDQELAGMDLDRTAIFTLRGADGAVYCYPPVSRGSSLSPTDRAVLYDLYAREALTALSLSEHLLYFDPRDRAVATNLFANMLGDHLLLIQRARELMEETGTPVPVIRAETSRADLSGETLKRISRVVHPQRRELVQRGYARVRDPRLAELVRDAEFYRERHTEWVADYVGFIARLPEDERVAGVRDEQ